MMKTFLSLERSHLGSKSESNPVGRKGRQDRLPCYVRCRKRLYDKDGLRPDEALRRSLTAYGGLCDQLRWNGRS